MVITYHHRTRSERPGCWRVVCSGSMSAAELPRRLVYCPGHCGACAAGYFPPLHGTEAKTDRAQALKSKQVQHGPFAAHSSRSA